MTQLDIQSITDGELEFNVKIFAIELSRVKNKYWVHFDKDFPILKIPTGHTTISRGVGENGEFEWVAEHPRFFRDPYVVKLIGKAIDDYEAIHPTDND